MADIDFTGLTSSTTVDVTDLVVKVAAPGGAKTHQKITLLNFIKGVFKLNQWEKNPGIGNPDAGYMALYADANGFFYSKDQSGGLRAITRPITFEPTVVGYTDSVTTGDGKWYCIIPDYADGMNLTVFTGAEITAGTTNTTDWQIYNVTKAQDMLSTKLVFASGATTPTPCVIDGTKDNVSAGDVLRLDCDVVSTTAPKGFIPLLEFQYP
jgi:hypothetical protein